MCNFIEVFLKKYKHITLRALILLVFLCVYMHVYICVYVYIYESFAFHSSFQKDIVSFWLFFFFFKK